MSDSSPPTPPSFVPAQLNRRFHGRALNGYFFEEIKEYIGFDEAVEERLRECKPIVKPHFADIVEAFYDALWANPRSRAVFTGPEQVKRLRVSLRRWLESSFTGPWDETYFALRMRIGRKHVDVGLLPQFMFGAMNVIRRHMVRVLTEAETSVEHLEAVERLLDLELTVMLQSYWDHMMQMKLEVPLALASGLAHEIRNPLNAIVLNLTLLERKMRAGGLEPTPIVDVINNEVRRLSLLTNEMMDFARPVDIHPAWHRAEEILAELEALHGPAFAAADIDFVAEVTGDAWIWCDRDRLLQALVNFVTNAIDAVEEDGLIRIEIGNESNATSVCVADNGIGMEPATIYQIFDLFFTRKAAGTGLGLPVIKNIIDAHDGVIEVHSKPGQGTTFLIRLPRPLRPDDPQEHQ